MHPALTQIEDDIYRVALPLPFALRIINAYLLRGEGGWTILDTGLNTSKARETWLGVFDSLAIDPIGIEQIVLTHAHPDHFGLAGWLQEHAKRVDGSLPPVKLSSVEYTHARMWGNIEQWGDETYQFWVQCDIPVAQITAVIESTMQTGRRTHPLPTHYELIEPETAVKLGNYYYQMYQMSGHSDGQLVFYHGASERLFVGDHVLSKITPNVSRWPEGLADPLGAYLESFQPLKALSIRQALPGHGPILTDIQQRIAEIEAHHAERLDLILTAVDQPKTVYQISNILFNHDKLSSHETRFAVTETLAHLEYWRFRGKLERTGHSPWIYQPA